MSTRQLPLNLGHRFASGRADFLVTDTNKDAVGWIDAWPDWPSNALGLYGPKGCGKSHLVHVFAAKTGAQILSIEDLKSRDPLSIAESCKAVAWDNSESLPDEQAFFHFFNAMRASGKSLLIVGRTAPARWPVSLPDLRSRLAGMPAVEILAPDDTTMTAVLTKLFHDRQLEISPGLIDFVLKRIPRTFAAIQKLVGAVDQEALAQNRKITVPLVRDVLDALASQGAWFDEAP